MHPFAPGNRNDPHPAYRWWREHAPVARDPFSGLWLVSTHAGCAAGLRAQQLSSAQGQAARHRQDGLPVSMLSADPPEHIRLRAPGSALLGASAVRALQPGLAATIDSVLDRVLDRASAGPAAQPAVVDAVGAIGEPFARDVLALVLGVPAAERDTFAGLARAASVSLDPLAAGPVAAQGAAAGAELAAFLTDHRERLLAEPPGPGVRSAVRDATLSPQEFVAMLALCVVGGYEPLAQLAGSALWWLLRRPAAIDRLRAGDQALARTAVAELLRLESPVPFTARVATADVELDGVVVPGGETVLLLLAAANRDPAVFADPDELHVDRHPNPHLALAAGPHHCLGAPLVLAAGSLLLHRLLRRAPALAPADPAVLNTPSWRTSLIPRGLVELPVRW